MSFSFKKNTLVYYFTIIVISILLSFFYYNTQVVKSSGELVDHTQEVLVKSNTVLIDILNVQTGIRGYVLTGNKDFLDPYTTSEKNIKSNILLLKQGTKNSNTQQIRVVELNLLVSKGLLLAEKIITKYDSNNLSESEKMTYFVDGKAISDTIRNIITSINNEEFKLLKEQKIVNVANVKTSRILFLFILLFIGLVTILVYFIFKNYNKRKIENDLDSISQKAASQYSLSLIEASRDPLFTINPEGKITDTNQASVRVTDVSKIELIGSDFISYFTEPEKAKEGYEQVFEKGFVVDFPLVIKDGKLTNVLFNGSVYKDDDGNVVGAVVVARDITDQKRIETELMEAKIFAELATSIAEDAKLNAETATKKAEEAVKSKQQFLSNMSHEIRTPMNAIIGFTKVVLKTELTAKQKEYLTAIKMSGDALIVLINDILDLAKVDAGKMTFEETPFKLSLSIDAMLHLFESKVQEKNLKLITNYDKSIPEVLIGDPVRLHQIILNLISNAVKFTHQGKILVAVNLKSDNEKKVTIEFSITDTGIGISEDKIETIFENFQQATSGTSRLFGGTGLGLAIVKQLVEGQNGTIKVESELGKGTTFSFTLYFKKTTSEAVLEPEISELNTDPKDLKILVVEDMELNQLLMKTLLDDFGFECEIAANGKLAVDRLKDKTFDIILMDLQMPEMNGFEATEYIRQTLKLTIPIIALTADVTTVDVAKCKAVGMNDYISKPVDERLLYSKLISHMKKPIMIIEQKNVGKLVVEKVKYIDMSYLTKLTKSNPKLMSEMINAYLKQTPELITVMKQSFKDKDWHMLQATVHKMIPSFTIMGINPEITEIAKRIQEYAHSLELSTEIENLVSELEKVGIQTCEELEIELKNLNK